MKTAKERMLEVREAKEEKLNAERKKLQEIEIQQKEEFINDFMLMVEEAIESGKFFIHADNYYIDIINPYLKKIVMLADVRVPYDAEDIAEKIIERHSAAFDKLRIRPVAYLSEGLIRLFCL